MNIDESTDIPSSSANKKLKEDFEFQGCPNELVRVLEEQISALEIAVSKTLATGEIKGTSARPWASEWKAQRLWIAIPVSGMSVENSLLDQVILHGMAKSKSRITIVPGAGAEDVPELSAEDERFLNGILTAMSGNCPTTLRCGSTSIVDLTFYSLWNLAAARFVSDKASRGNVHPSVLPDKPIKGGRASEYLAGRLQALAGTLGTNHSHIAKTLERVIKVWTEERASATADLLASTRIPWSLVLSKGGEFKTKKVGKNRTEVRSLTTPHNPKESAWIMPYERKLIAHLCAPVWGQMDKLQKEWAAFSGPETHSNFESYIGKLKTAYIEMRSISESMTKRLGQRKAIILNSPAIRKLSKKDLKSKTSNELVMLFSKSNLPALPMKAKSVYEPFYVGENLFVCKEMIRVFGETNYIVAIKTSFSQLLAQAQGLSKTMLTWENEWIKAFEPPNEIRFKDIPADATETSNMFGALLEEE